MFLFLWMAVWSRTNFKPYSSHTDKDNFAFVRTTGFPNILTRSVHISEADDLQKRTKKQNTSFLFEEIMRVCDIFRIQGQGVFPLPLSIVPAATLILGEQSSIQG